MWISKTTDGQSWRLIVLIGRCLIDFFNMDGIGNSGNQRNWFLDALVVFISRTFVVWKTKRNYYSVVMEIVYSEGHSKQLLPCPGLRVLISPWDKNTKPPKTSLESLRSHHGTWSNSSSTQDFLWAPQACQETKAVQIFAQDKMYFCSYIFVLEDVLFFIPFQIISYFLSFSFKVCQSASLSVRVLKKPCLENKYSDQIRMYKTKWKFVGGVLLSLN